MLSKKPPMGFNTWNTFGREISDTVVRETADAMIDRGFAAAGYEYLVIDDCWSKRERDPETGKIVPEPTKFPNGMKAVSDYVHSKGLKFGMYSCAGLRTCDNYPGSFDHEYLDAKTFAEYGVDFLKYDFCYRPEYANGPLLYRKMSMALKASGREILFSACNWGMDEVNTWIRSTGAHMYRSTGDIFDNFVSFRDIFLSQTANFAYSAPGCFNDIDMLTVGMYGKGNVGTTACNDTEYKTQFALWCLASSPLMLGCDVRNVNETSLKLLQNKNLIRINQDEEGRPPFVANHNNDNKCNVYVKVLSNNQFAVMFTNLDESERNVWFYLENMGITAASGKGLHMTDAFTNEDMGVVKEYMSVNLAPHDCAVYLAEISD